MLPLSDSVLQNQRTKPEKPIQASGQHSGCQTLVTLYTGTADYNASMFIPKDRYTRLVAIAAAGIIVATYAIAQSGGIADSVVLAPAPGPTIEVKPEQAPAQSPASDPNAEMPDEIDDEDSANLDLPITGDTNVTAGQNQVDENAGRMNFDGNGNLVRSDPQTNRDSSFTSGNEAPEAE